MDLDAWTQMQLELVDMERRAEEAQTAEEHESLNLKQLEERGVVIGSLVLTEQKHGLGGRTLVTLSRSKALGGKKNDKGRTESSGSDPLLPAHCFGGGDIVALRKANMAYVPSSSSKEQELRGLVYRVFENKIVVALDSDENADILDGTMRMFKLANDITYKRYRKAMSTLQEASRSASRRLTDVLFSQATPHFRPEKERDWTPENRNLNEPQLNAIDFCLRAADVALIHGPPGTGKTTTVVELIVQAVRRGDKVLACAPSNIAVDNLAERLAAHKRISIVRIGHPARMLDSVLDSSLDLQVQRSEGKALAKDAREDINKILSQMRKKSSKVERSRMRTELSSLRAEVRTRENRAVEEIIRGAQVVLCTNTGASDPVLNSLDAFDLCVIDEAAMALEVSCWIPILRSKRLVLAGDDCQLAPTIISKEAAAKGLGRTLFQRVREEHGEGIARMLTVQYRMHEDISDWCSGAMYAGRLVPAEGVRRRTLLELPGVEETAETAAVLVVVDTDGCGMEEEQDEKGSSRNEGEAMVVLEHLERLLAAGVKEESVGILAPYNGQVAVLRDKIKERHRGVEIGTVDGFQGREKDALILSLVRSNTRREVGFLSDDRRLNVAITRARSHVCLVCDSRTVSSHPFIRQVLDHCEGRDALWLSAQEYVDGYVGGGSVGGGGKGRRVEKKKLGKEEREEEVEREKEEARARLSSKVDEFMAGSDETVAFPSALSPFERRLLHEEAERRGLGHSSVGEGTSRRIVLSKKNEVVRGEEIQEDKKEEEEEEGGEDKEEEEEELAGALSCLRVESEEARKDPTMNSFSALMEAQEASSNIRFSVVFEKETFPVEIEAAKTIGDVKKILEDRTVVSSWQSSSSNISLFGQGVAWKDQTLVFKRNLSNDFEVGQYVKPGSKVMLLGRRTRTISASAREEEESGAATISLTAQLHQERLQRMQEQAKKEEAQSVGSESGRGGSKGTAKKKGKGGGGGGGGGGGAAAGAGAGAGKAGTIGKSREKLEDVDPDDVDAVMRALDLDRGVSSCGVEGCKNMIHLIGSFCVGHVVPELHGCGKAAKEEARATWMLEQAQAREEARLRQQGRPLETGWKQHKSAVLKNELQKKIAAKEDERARKKKDDDRKKK